MLYLSDTIDKERGEYTETVTILLHIAEITWQVYIESYTIRVTTLIESDTLKCYT